VGDFERAEDYFYRGIDVHEQTLELTVQGQGRDRIRRQYAACLLNLGSMLSKLEGSKEDGVELIREARAVMEEALEERPVARNRATMVSILHNFAEVVAGWEEKLDLLLQAVEISRSLVTSSPGNRTYRSLLATTLGAAGHLHYIQRTAEDYARAEELLDEAVMLLRRLCREFPEDGSLRHRLGEKLTSQCLLAQDLGKPDDVVEAGLRECLELLDELCEEGVPQAHINRGVARHCLAMQLDKQQRSDELQELRRQTIHDLQEAREQYPRWRAELDYLLSDFRRDWGLSADG
jgi:hypothetical protein